MALLQKVSIITHPISLNSSGIATVDDIDESKGIWQVVHNNIVHNVRLPDARAVNDYNTVLVWKQSK